MKHAKFEVSKADSGIITRIANRAERLAAQFEIEYNFMTADMDITACHANGNPLRLTELLMADDFNFSHDVFGIRNHINRQTGELEDCFRPRYSAC